MAQDITHFAAKAQKPGETVDYVVNGWTGNMMGQGLNKQRNGALILTDQRVVFYRKFLLTEVCETIPLDKITSIDRSRGIHGQLTIHAAATILHFKSLEMKRLDEMHERLERRVGEMASRVQDVRAPAPADDSTVGQIERLAALRDKGVLTDEEFAAQKSRLLR